MMTYIRDARINLADRLFVRFPKLAWLAALIW